MNRSRTNARAANYFLCGVLSVLAISVCAAGDRPARINLFPRLQSGQALNYQVSYHSDKHVKTDSSVIVAIPNDSVKIDVSALLRLEVLGVQAAGDRGIIRARTTFEALDSDAHFKAPQFESPAPQLQKQEGKVIGFNILSDGRLDQVTGLDALFPDQQQAWQEWAARFLLAAGLGSSTGRIAQKWKSEEAEKSASPLAGIRWIRESTYVRDEPCRAVGLTAQGNLASSDADTETCAVFLSTATLRQDSKAKNATPEDYKLHDLRTAGTASGSNRIITYVSLKTGLLVRASEEATQQMNVTVTKADASNRVVYDIKAKSRSEVLRVSETALSGP